MWNSFNITQLDLIEKIHLGTEEILLFDGDEAGRKNAERVCTENLGRMIKVAILPEGIDPDKYVKENGGYILQDNIIRKSIGGLEFLVRRKLRDDFKGKRNHINDIKASPPEAKILLLDSLRPAFGNFHGDNIGIYYDALGKMLDLPEKEVEQFFSIEKKQRLEKTYDSREERWERTTEQRLIIELIHTGLSPTDLNFCKTHKTTEILQHPETRAVLMYFLENPEKRSTLDYLSSPLFALTTQRNDILVEITNFAKERHINPDLDETAYLLDAGMRMRHSGIEPVNHETLELFMREIIVTSFARESRRKFGDPNITSLPTAIEKLIKFRGENGENRETR